MAPPTRGVARAGPGSGPDDGARVGCTPSRRTSVHGEGAIRDAGPGGRRPVLEHCGLDVDRFERLVEQNSYGESTDPGDEAE